MFALIIPSYNSMGTLPATLSSVLKLEDRQRVELILTDDGSTDGTRDFLQKWSDEHRATFGRVVLNLNPANLGATGNHIKGFSLAKSVYGTYIGSDDLFESPTFPRDLENAIAAQPGLVIGRTDVIAYDVPQQERWHVFGRHGNFFTRSARRQYALFAMYGSLHRCGPGTVLHIPTLLSTPGTDDVRYMRSEDKLWHLQLILHGYAVRYLDVPGIVWIRSDAGASYKSKGKLYQSTASIFSDDGERAKKELIRPNLYRLMPWEWLIWGMQKCPWPLPNIARRLDPFKREYYKQRELLPIPSES
jgi:glycosyltransferase involved in cell wall biosynthesis